MLFRNTAFREKYTRYAGSYIMKTLHCKDQLQTTNIDTVKILGWLPRQYCSNVRKRQTNVKLFRRIIDPREKYQHALDKHLI